MQVLVTDLNYNKIETEAIQFVTNDIVKVYFSTEQTGYAHLTYGGSSESGSSGSSGISGSSGLSGSIPGGSINNLQYKSGTTTFGGSNDLTIDTNSTPTTLTMVGNIAVSNGNVTVNNSQVAIIDEVIALSIALG